MKLLQYEVGSPANNIDRVGRNENQKNCVLNTLRTVSHGFRKRDAHNVNDLSCKFAGSPFEKLERTS